MTSELPKPGSVWGVPDQPDTWRYVYLVDGLNVRSRSIVTGRVSEEHVAIWESRNREVGNVDITAMLSAFDELQAAIERGGLDLSCCMDCGAPVVCIPDGLPMCEACAVKNGGERPAVSHVDHARLIAWLKDPNRKSPVIAFTSGPERQIADLALMVNTTHDTSLNEPTVDWLVEIGGLTYSRSGNPVVSFCRGLASPQLEFIIERNCWQLSGMPVDGDLIKTKRDVLKWLDVLGIVPATEKPT